ncbi:hypothetical protein COF61_31250 [Bacillus toyonensis]|uniref:hypothetical protein n=1 Tax=Bacillus toyonensis TaxID=155322 RepID=UPI000BFCC942|nr:hypothetical protein [Bacillus toyonensis]PHD54541.1 hypothetical protein COF61_31250 [Bacillus toyonensis]
MKFHDGYYSEKGCVHFVKKISTHNDCWYSGNKFGRSTGRDCTCKLSSKSGEKVIDKEVIGRPAKGIGKGLLREIRELSVSQANNQYYLQDTTRGAKIITMDGKRRDADNIT